MKIKPQLIRLGFGEIPDGEITESVQNQIQQWLRIEHGITTDISYMRASDDTPRGFSIHMSWGKGNSHTQWGFPKREHAFKNILKKCLEVISKRQPQITSPR